jgi:murein DD-endopeptidase MepM/ murein hydrolase activator NlpD
MQRTIVMLAAKTDSLTRSIESRDRYLANLKAVISGDLPADSIKKPIGNGTRFDTIDVPGASEAEKKLRAEIEARDRFSLYAEASVQEGSLSNFLFFTPVKGIITSEFSPKTKHFGIDIVASANEVIKSTLDGTVIFSDWTSDTGYMIAVQHGNNLFSIYKHNSALLKSAGDFVKAGEVIAIIGDSGELTTGPHLHFELWYNGTAVNPIEYMTF